MTNISHTGSNRQAYSIMMNSFFVYREIDNLQDQVTTITGMPSTHLVVDYSSSHIKFSVKSAYDEAYQNIEFDFAKCLEYGITFPDVLRNFLDKSSLNS